MLENDNLRRRRKRATKSCFLCRKRKLRCDRELPCGNCQRSRSGSCHYTDEDHSNDRLIAATRASPTPGLQTPVSLGNDDLSRDGQRHSTALAERPSIARPSINDTDEQDATAFETRCELAGTWHVYSGGPQNEGHGAVVRGLAHKTRLFGQSHWAISGVSLGLEAYSKAEAHASPSTMVAAVEALQRCKALGRTIKARRAPTWPCSPTADLPDKALADTLVENYMETFEATQRILHLPTFYRDYEELYAGTKHDMGLTMQVKLVLAIGAVAFDDHFTLRILATRWVYEAQCWMSEPKFKSRLALQGLQTQALLIVAHERVGIGGDPTFVSAGSLMRKAIHMGLHRDPSRLPKRSRLADEVRRRLWSTILELNLQSSLSAGAPVAISMADFDARSPANFNDDDLTDEDARPALAATFTQTTIAVVLRRSFPARLALAKFLNNLQSPISYKETMQHDAAMRIEYRTAMRSLAAAAGADDLTERQLESSTVELIFLKCILALHAPYASAAIRDSRYAFSRKAVVDASLKVCHIIFRKPEAEASSSSNNNNNTTMYRLLTCSSGFFPITAMHASHLLAVECRSLLEEQESLGPPLLRQDLLDVLEHSKQWCLDSIEAGRVSVRGLQLTCAVQAQIEALKNGLDPETTSEYIVSASVQAVRACLPILERQAAGLIDASSELDLSQDQPAALTENDLMEDWGFMTAEPMFLAGNEWFMDDITHDTATLWP